MTGKRHLSVALGAILLLGAASNGLGFTFSGNLLYEDWGNTNTGLDVGSGNPDGWGNYTKIEWLVSTEQPGSPALHPVYYEYTVTVRKYELSHMIVELSESFGLEDLTQLKVNGVDHGEFSITTHDPGPGNPRMPEDLYGLKFDDLGGGFDDGDENIVTVMSFFSNRLPVWGDAYLKCGGFGNNAFNTGFTVNDVDPADPAASGSIQGHLLVPNSVIPEPAALSLLGLGSLFLIRRRK